MRNATTEKEGLLYRLLVLGPLWVLACSSGSTALHGVRDAGAPGDASNASSPDGEPADAGAAGTLADGAAAASAEAGLALEGPCIEGMECVGNDPGGSLEFGCRCVNGSWTCPLADTRGVLASVLPLPAGEPQDGTTCNPGDYACTVPSHCGSLCICTGVWHCRTVSDGPDGGARISDGIPDAGATLYPGACAWPPCPGIATPPPAGEQCFTAACFSTVYPSGATLFAPGELCSVEH